MGLPHRTSVAAVLPAAAFCSGVGARAAGKVFQKERGGSRPHLESWHLSRQVDFAPLSELVGLPNVHEIQPPT